MLKKNATLSLLKLLKRVSRSFRVITATGSISFIHRLAVLLTDVDNKQLVLLHLVVQRFQRPSVERSLLLQISSIQTSFQRVKTPYFRNFFQVFITNRISQMKKPHSYERGLLYLRFNKA